MKPLITIGVIVILVIAGFFLFKPQTKQTPTQLPTPIPTQTQEVNITANFTIITGNITRNFSAEKYHNKSPDVYIESSDPTKIVVKKSGITWADFFNTLPMKLTKECLTTGDGENYCDRKDGFLKFFLNDLEDKNLLDKEIEQGDNALIKFT